MVPLPLSAPGQPSGQARLSPQIVSPGRVRTVCAAEFSSPPRMGEVLGERKIQTKHSAPSQDGITGTRFRFPPKTTKQPDKTFKTGIFKTLNSRQQRDGGP